MNVLLVGAEAAGARCLALVQQSGHRVVAVMTPRGEESGAALAAAADRLELDVFDPVLVRHADFAAQVEDLAVDILLNVHSLHVIHPDVIAAPRIGSFNLHPGPLPEYAGLSVPSWAIYRGERRHAVTLHWMAADVDAGHIAYEAELPISDTDTGLSLSVACVREGLPLIERLLDDAQEQRIPAREQDLARRRWHGPASPHRGALPWTLPAHTVVNLVRASDYGPFRSPWGRPRTVAGERELEVLAAKPTGLASEAAPGTVGDRDGDGVRVAAGDQWVLVGRVRDEQGTAAAANRLEQGLQLREPPVTT
jgi:UDP-4-amino-4-deoxy-L-arabinose formyltransferase/UDP-glucuronic acid dehydrogenase (UDP-4-keto-hexauronic acid decarboxylating)